jgi:hypothetical protein
MAPPEVAGGGDDFEILKVVGNILNKQLWTADKGCSNLEVGRWAKNSPQKRNPLRNVTNCLGLGRILWINDLS